MNPVFNGPRRVAVESRRFIRTGSMEDVEDNMKAMIISPFWTPRYFILNGCDKCICIWNRYLFHREHPLYQFAPSITHQTRMRNYLWRYI